jgi:hypothetical protein
MPVTSAHSRQYVHVDCFRVATTQELMMKWYVSLTMDIFSSGLTKTAR